MPVMAAGGEKSFGPLQAVIMRHVWRYIRRIKAGIVASTLTIHADRGTSMTSKPVALLMADLGVTKTLSRPHVSDDNPYSGEPPKE